MAYENLFAEGEPGLIDRYAWHRNWLDSFEWPDQGNAEILREGMNKIVLQKLRAKRSAVTLSSPFGFASDEVLLYNKVIFHILNGDVAPSVFIQEMLKEEEARIAKPRRLSSRS